MDPLTNAKEEGRDKKSKPRRRGGAVDGTEWRRASVSISLRRKHPRFAPTHRDFISRIAEVRQILHEKGAEDKLRVLVPQYSGL
jgi:hypothetical protein